MIVVMNPPQLAQWIKQLGVRFEPTVLRGIRAGALRCVHTMQQRTMQAPPVKPNQSTGVFDTGLYKAAWKAEPMANGARVLNDRPYSGVIEHGRRPSPVSREGIRNITAWVHRKLKVPTNEAEAVAWAIARKMRQHPLLPRHVMTNAIGEMATNVTDEILHELTVELRRGP